MTHPHTVTVRAAGAAFVLDTTTTVPTVLHWGADLPDTAIADLRATSTPAALNNAPDAPRQFSVWPSEHDGWSGTPAQRGHAAGTCTTPRPRLHRIEHRADAAGGGSIEIELTDASTGLSITLHYAMDPFGVLSIDTTLRLDHCLAGTDTPYTLDGIRTLMPVPDVAVDVMDFTGKWCRERSPQRTQMRDGTLSRRAHRGKPGHDSPFLAMVGSEGFGFRRGQVWATHLAWSGESEYLVERLPEAAGAHSSVIGVGELLHPGEILISDGDSYQAPTALFVWSDVGMDGLADRLHRRLRARTGHPSSPRPLVLNTWEAVYFDHDLDTLTALADAAARVGVERMVLDDGWFKGRRSDNAGLGDWSVDESVWPHGLGPLVQAIRDRGMQFGLWFEPEMINPDSDAARTHPEWILGPAGSPGPLARNQQVIDLANAAAYEHVLEQISTLVDAHHIDYLKWDHNRDLLEAVHPGSGRPAVGTQTRALYRMLAELHTRHPWLEIETCSGGGGRVDLGILAQTERLWPSDCNDPVERSQIERWTKLLVPPELIGSHIGVAHAHTTGRSTDLSYRLATALTSHAGIEMDLTKASEQDLHTITAWAATYKELRGLFHSGTVVNADLPDDSVSLRAVVSPDADHAVAIWARSGTSGRGQHGRVPWPGLSDQRRYRIRVLDLGPVSRHVNTDPAWLTQALGDGIEVHGAVLTTAGLPMPTLNPQQALVLELVAV